MKNIHDTSIRFRFGRIKRALFWIGCASMLFFGLLYQLAAAPRDAALSIDREQLKNAIREDLESRITEAIESNVESLQDAMEDKIYQEIKAAITSRIDTEAIQKQVDQMLESHPTVKRLVEDYKNEESQQVLSDLQGLYGEAKGQLSEIVNSLNAYQEESEPDLEYFKKLEEMGFKGRWVDKIGEWEAFYEQHGASVVEDMQTLYDGFHGGEPGGQLLALFSLMEKYSDKVPGLGRFVKLYAQVGKEMLAAAIRAGELIRQREQGCLGEGTHSGIKNWYNVGDPVNIAFTQAFAGQTACPTAFDNIFRDEDDQSVLYFWDGTQFLRGESGNGGAMAIAQIIAFLQSAGMGDQVKDVATLHKFYNQNFPLLKQLVETMLERISTHLRRLDNVRIVCGDAAFQTLISELGLFNVTPQEFEDRKPKIVQRMIISRVLEDGQAFQTYDMAESALSQLYAVIVRGKVYQYKSGQMVRVEAAQVEAELSGGAIFSHCQQMQTDKAGSYRMVVLLDQTEAQLRLVAKKRNLKSEPVELLLQQTDFYRDEVDLELKAKDDTTRVPESIAVNPASAEIVVGETKGFSAELTYNDGSTRNVTGTASWSGGNQNSFTGSVPGEATLTASFLGLSGSAQITIKCPDDRPDWNSELGECTSIDAVIDSMAEEPPDEYCDENQMLADWVGIQQLVSEALYIETRFSGKHARFLKEINDQNSNTCKNNLLAIAFAGAKRDWANMETLIEQVQSSATNLILQMGICPDLKLDFGIRQIVEALAQIRPLRTRMVDGLAEMRALLANYGCDEEEVTERGEEVADNTNDPNVIDDGGAGGEEICGDGKDNDGDGLIDEDCETRGNYNVTFYLYDSGSAKDDVFSLSVSGFGD
ncbi:Ig-like domain-containing protein, partial [candidate division KSB1 bacterium]|nr:Ig-like domain-containing protein [candidate division KSB1 bacterium]